MKKSELEAEIKRLQERVETLEQAFRASIQGGLVYKRRFEECFLFLKKIPGLQSGPMWSELQALIQKYDVIDHPTYGEIVVPKTAHQFNDHNTKCVCCGLADE